MNRKKAIRRALNAGAMPVAIAGRLSVSRAYVQRIARAMGWSHAEVIEARRRRVAQQQAQGWTRAESAKVERVSVRTIDDDRRATRKR